MSIIYCIEQFKIGWNITYVLEIINGWKQGDFRNKSIFGAPKYAAFIVFFLE